MSPTGDQVINRITRSNLIRLVKQVQQSSACISDFDGLMGQLEKASGSSQIGQLIFDPPNGRELSAEEIVDLIQSQGQIDMDR